MVERAYGMEEMNDLESREYFSKNGNAFLGRTGLWFSYHSEKRMPYQESTACNDNAIFSRSYERDITLEFGTKFT